MSSTATTTFSCSHWWHAPIYLTLSIFLAFFSISSFHPPPSSTVSTTSPPPISAAATTALRSNNFSIMATLLQFSPQIFFLPSSSPPLSSTTVFAVSDAAFSTISAAPSAVELMLKYHTLPVKLNFQELLRKENFSCLNTLIPSKNVSLIKIFDGFSNKSIVLINNVTVTHPDLFLDDFISIHGVSAPFTSLDHHLKDDFFINSPYCNDNKNNINNNKNNQSLYNSRYAAEWVKMIRALSSSGFVSFAIGLNSVMGRVLDNNTGLGPVTVLAPMDFGFVGSSEWLLDRVVRYHVLSQRYTCSELAAVPAHTVLTTLLADNVVEVTVNANVSHGLAVNGVDVVSPEVFSSRMFVVHGISRALDFLDHVDT
ncbi:hypothetical protein RND81_05G071300 [Saponaria officinalis]|uniref:FAS1 domain-containing protein n=1 Tax=Saponaria officinalis TaxID=3572 RepID=A0AAW1KYQ4_SAPOF